MGLFCSLAFLFFLVASVFWLVKFVLAIFKRQNKKKPLVWFVVCFVLMCVFAMFVPTDESASSPEGTDTAEAASTSQQDDAEPTPTPTEEPTPEPILEPAEEPEEVSTASELHLEMADIIPSVETILDESYNGNYSLDYDDSSVTVNLWYDGVALGATMAADGDAEYQKQWDTLVNSMTQQTESLVDVFETAGLNDVVVLVNVLNDQNKDNTLLSVLNGIVIYDAVQQAQNG